MLVAQSSRSATGTKRLIYTSDSRDGSTYVLSRTIEDFRSAISKRN
jgi:hypothetical protein